MCAQVCVHVCSCKCMVFPSLMYVYMMCVYVYDGVKSENQASAWWFRRCRTTRPRRNSPKVSKKSKPPRARVISASRPSPSCKHFARLACSPGYFRGLGSVSRVGGRQPRLPCLLSTDVDYYVRTGSAYLWPYLCRRATLARPVAIGTAIYGAPLSQLSDRFDTRDPRQPRLPCSCRLHKTQQ